MTYQTLYRTYRSNDLSELVGQPHIVQTLQNALQCDRLAHAYIFSGPRGTGKTSTARILAKLINKTTDQIADCPLCRKIADGTCMDVVEIDAASHTGVDYMRQLIEQVQFLPVEAHYKVFIVDEVHMLSTAAFNALLKTLEEPPHQVLFILATTEHHKIPATIQSRAQTLHFKLIQPNDIAQHLTMILNKEHHTMDADAVQKVVRIANGGMRDALSLLDQLMSICTDQHITVSDVLFAIGGIGDDQIEHFLRQCFDADITAHQTLMTTLENGVDVRQFYDDIVAYLHHHVLVHADHPFNAPESIISDWLLWFCYQIQHLSSIQDAPLHAQIALYARLTNHPSSVTPSAPPPASTPTAPPQPVTPSAPPPASTPTAPSQSVTPSAPPPASTPTATPQSVTPSAPPPASTPTATPQSVTPSAPPPATTPTAPSQSVTPSAPPPASTPTATPQPVTPSAPPPASTPTATPQTATPSALPPASTPTATPQSVTPSAPPPATDQTDLSEQVMRRVTTQFPAIRPGVTDGKLVSSGDTLYLILGDSSAFFEKKLNESKFKTCFLSTYNDLSGQSLCHWCVTGDINVLHASTNSTPTDTAPLVPSSPSKPTNSIKSPPTPSPLSKTVNQIIEIFEGKIIE